MSWTSLHRLLGEGAGPLTSEMIDDAIAQQLNETGDLDFKSELPPAKGLPQTDYPKDIAAMANSGGGTIIFGVKEEDKAASARLDVGEVSETYERTLRSVAVSAISPPVFGLAVHRLGEPGKRNLVVVVPPSIDGPHLVYRNELFGAPIRNDADTVWMRESQIESMYRARFDEHRHAVEALNTMCDEAVAGRDTIARAWIVMVAHPRRPSGRRTPPTRDEASALFVAGAKHGRSYSSGVGVNPLANTGHQNPRPGLRRWVAPNVATAESSKWKEAWSAIHHDGSISIASAIGGHQKGSGTYWSGQEIESIGIECAVADLMGLARSAGEHFGIDEYEVRIGIEWNGLDPIVILTRDQHGFPYDRVSTPLAHYTPVDSSVLVRVDADDFHRQVALLAEDCVNQGGITNLQIIHPPAASC